MSGIIDTQSLTFNHFRVNGEHRRLDYCEWCKNEKLVETAVYEIWSIAHPNGRLVRLCDNCAICCAAG